MARNIKLFIYNETRADQEWSIYSEGVINQTVTVDQTRKSYTLSLSGDATIQFGVADTVYLKADYTFSTDSWSSSTVTPNEIQFSTSQGAVTVSSSYK